jgi:cell volume regulation protein A
VGLKGAVPIILATYPLMAGLPAGPTIFNVVFFVVLVSAVVQGGLLPWFARRLKLEEPPIPEAPLSLEITSLRDVDAEIIDYPVLSTSPAVGRLVRDLALPEGAVVAMISREKAVIPPRGSTVVCGGDHLFVVANQESRLPVDAIFARSSGEKQAFLRGEFPLRGTVTSQDLNVMYGVDLGAPGEATLETLIRAHTPQADVGDVVVVSGVHLRVREMSEGRIVSVGLSLAEDVP